MTRARFIAGIVLTLVLGAVVGYAVSPASFEIARPGQFEMAVLILGYVLFPVLVLLAIGLLLVALLIYVGGSIERRRQRSPK